MKTIPLESAIDMLDTAIDVIIELYPCTVSLVVEPKVEFFMHITAEEDDLEFDFRFHRDENPMVVIDGEWMTLQARDGDGGLAGAVRMRLTVPMDLEAMVK